MIKIFKFFLIIFFIFIIADNLYSQVFSAGILGGVSASQVDGDSYGGFDKVGLHGGVFISTLFSDKWGIEFDIKYTARGARKKTSDLDPEIYKLTLNYIDLPVLLWYTFKNKYTFEAGLLTGYLFYASGEDSGGKLPDDFLVNFKKFDYCWLLGFKYNITNNFSLGVRYSYSLFSISKVKNTDGKYGIIGNIFGYITGDYNNFLTFSMIYRFL